MHTGFWWKDLMGRDKLEDRGVDRRIILKCIFNKHECGSTGYFVLTHDMDNRRALLKKVRDYRAKIQLGGIS
jgi:uncharacterized membrane protein